MNVLDSRRAAVDLLNRVEEERSFLEPLLAARLSRASHAGGEDRGLLTELSYGTLRMRNRLDWVIENFYRGTAASLDRGLRNILRVSLYQLLCMDRIPSYAAVNEAVKLTKRRYPGREALVNGLLRNVLRRRENIPFPDYGTDPVAFLSRYHSHPQWLVERWVSQFGLEETRALCEANNGTPPVVVRVNRLKTNSDEAIRRLARDGVKAEKSRWSPDGLVIGRRGSFPLRDLELVQAGHLQVQDEASQLISFLVDPRPGEMILDLCSGAGIKAAHLAALMNNRGAIMAMDRNGKKLAAGEEAARTMGVAIIKRIEADAREDMGSRYRERFDRILLDAPCSGLGTIRRKPEIKWFAGEEDGRELARLQRDILQVGSGYLKPGGVLVYATCTLSTLENEDLVRDFLEENRFFELLAPPPIISSDMIEGRGFFRTMPHRHGTDGFFGAVLRKRGG